MIELFKKKVEKKPEDFFGLDFARLEKYMGRPIVGTEREQFELFWLAADAQIVEKIRSSRALGEKMGRSAATAAFALRGRTALENFKSERAKSEAAGNLDRAALFQTKINILGEITIAIMEV